MFEKFEIKGGFWDARGKINREKAIFHQWEQLERTGCIDNFRIAAGLKEGFREGFFFSDSDAYKWLDAAARILSIKPSPRLELLVDDFISVLEKAQQEDGYLYTYNQVHFKGSRWQNLQIEHELYCLGHLIEAGVSHHHATGDTRLLDIARRAADLLVREFMDGSPLFTDGHEEIEIALIRLARHTGETGYRELAKRFINRRGHIPLFGLRFFKQYMNSMHRMRVVENARSLYYKTFPGVSLVRHPADNKRYTPPFTRIRFYLSALRGKYIQQHAPFLKHRKPVGHSVRFTYLYTAAAMLVSDEGDQDLLDHLERIWMEMITKRMYVTGGLGALPLLEGFGRDYELDPEAAYAETCAALGCMFWNHEMSLLTCNSRYAELYEWQLYNAASVGMGLEGRSYFYNNPLLCRGGITREAWYAVPCCPSNLSRVWASLGETVLVKKQEGLYLNQYFSGTYSDSSGIKLHVDSGLPWTGEVRLRFYIAQPAQVNLNFRIPSWTDDCSAALNGSELVIEQDESLSQRSGSAVGLAVESSRYGRISREFKPGDNLMIRFSMPLRLLKQDKRLPKCGGMVALARGPLVYCLESLDNGSDIFSLEIDPHSLELHQASDLFGGTTLITGKSIQGQQYTWIPYMYWGNRRESAMTVFFYSGRRS